MRPVCGACLHRNSTCTFQSLPGLTRTAALKSEVAQLRTNSSNLLDLYRQLRDGSAVEARNLVEKIRSGEVPIDVPPNPMAGQRSISGMTWRPSGLFEALDPAISRHSRKMSQPVMASSQGASPPFHVAKRYAASQRHPTKATDQCATTEEPSPMPQPRIDEPLSYQQAEFSTPFYQGEDNDVSLQMSLWQNLSKIQEGFHMQQSCISEMFFCHSKDTFEILMSCLKQDCADPPKSSILCEICAVASIAGQYVQDALPSGVLEQWYSRRELQTRLCFYSNRADTF